MAYALGLFSVQTHSVNRFSYLFPHTNPKFAMMIPWSYHDHSLTFSFIDLKKLDIEQCYIMLPRQANPLLHAKHHYICVAFHIHNQANQGPVHTYSFTDSKRKHFLCWLPALFLRWTDTLRALAIFEHCYVHIPRPQMLSFLGVIIMQLSSKMRHITSKNVK